MKNKGFTLIELLAVIVILAIIALIATPIILGIINDAREESNERSVELYASAVRNAIAAYQLTNTNAPTKFTDLTIQYDGDVECTTEELYEDGSFYIAGCTVNGTEVEYTYGEKQEKLVYLNDVCTIAADSTVQGLNAGAKYNCTVDPNKPAYTFYVLTTAAEGAESVNLIMDSNITSTGEAIKDAEPADKGLVAWVIKDDYISEEIGGTEAGWDKVYDDCGNWNKGPISAMNHLASATKDWTNVNAQTIITFNDEAGTLHDMGKTYTVNARMPYYSEISNVSNSTLYLVDYLSNDYEITGRNGVNGVYGYWTLSSYVSNPYTAWGVSYACFAGGSNVNNDGYNGVRPVINLSI